MSSYFLGGFSAYLMVPSGRKRNHSGCSRTHGWSGAHWIAKSSATSLRRAAAAGTKRRESRERAEVGVDCAMAALGRTDCIGAARVTGLGDRAVVPALAVDPADRMD